MPKFLKEFPLSAKFVLSCLPRNNLAKNLAKKEETCRDLTWLEGSKTHFFDCGAKAAA